MGGTGEVICEHEMTINNVLCYASTARHSMGFDEITRICISFYGDEEIVKAKDLLCNLTGEKIIRRRHENRILNEFKDIMDMLRKSDERGIKLPKFVVDSYDGLPPSSGFETVASCLNTLMDEISKLKEEIKEVKTRRKEEYMLVQDNSIMKEDLIVIKGEIRKLNHRLIGDEIRRNSFMLSTYDQPTKSKDKALNDLFLGNSEFEDATSTCREIENDTLIEETQAFASAPPASQESWLPLVLPYQEGGTSPLAPSYAGIVNKQCESNQPVQKENSEKDDESRRKEIRNEFLAATSPQKEYLAAASPQKKEYLAAASPQKKKRRVIDKEGFELVQKKYRKTIVGSKKNSSMTSLKSAPRKAEIYVGNCNLTVTPEDIKDYILNETNITIDECAPLDCKDPRCKSFRIMLDMKHKDTILSADVWPEEIICRQFYHSRRTNKHD